MSDVKPKPELGEGQVLVDLPKGHWAVLRDPDEITNKDRKTIIAASEAQPGGDTSKAIASLDKLVAIAVIDWSYFWAEGDTDPKLPKHNLALLDELSPRAVDEMIKAAQSHLKEVFPDFEPSPDDESPS